MTAAPRTCRYTPESDEPLGAAIISALSKAKGRDISHDEWVLYDSVDPDALDSIFRSDGTDSSVKVEFVTHDAIVVVWGDGEITIEVQDKESDPNR